MGIRDSSQRRSPELVLQAVFKILPGEGRTVALLIALMLCAQAGGSIGSSSIQALFFARLGVGLLPTLYVVLGIVTILFTLAVIFPLAFYHHSWSFWLAFDHLVEGLPKFKSR